MTNRVIQPDSVKEPVPDIFGTVEFEVEHFAEGTCRKAFKGKLFKVEKPQGPNSLTNQQKDVFTGWNRQQDSYPCVVKLYKSNVGVKALIKNAWSSDIRDLEITRSYCDAFNAVVSANKKLTVASPLLAKITQPGYDWFLFFYWNSVTIQGEWVFIEPFLVGTFEKFLSNNGWVNTQQNAKLAIAFSHFTWHHSKGEVCITDLQGSRGSDSENYILTDPAIQTKKGGSNVTDLGIPGMEAFFSTHECNEFCRGFSKPNWPKPTVPPKWYGKKASTLTWQM